MKTCINCNETKSLSEFNQKQGKCKECQKIYKRSIPLLISNIYTHQKEASKKRCHNPPIYSKGQLMVWVLSQPNFLLLYSNWVKSDYKKHLIPSVDRLNDFKGYSFDNIQLITFRENNTKSKLVMSKQVFQYDKELNLINSFQSVVGCGTTLSIKPQNISRYCNNQRHHKKYIFSYSKLH